MKWKELLTPVESMDPEEARKYINEHKEGSYTLLDVRQPSEYEAARIPGATLIPIGELPDRIGELDPLKPVIAYWAIGGRSRAAAQLLAGKGFKDVYNLKGGLKAWQGHKAAGPADMGMAFLRGDETPVEIILLAYGMEDGLEHFYLTAAQTMGADDPDVENLLKKLAGIEEKHKQRLFDLYLRVQPGDTDRESFEQNIVSDVMEGGFTTEEFLEKNRDAMKTVPDLLSIAMMLEAQAMDLYMRYSQEISEKEGRTILQDMAEEEKTHLKALGRLMEGKV